MELDSLEVKITGTATKAIDSIDKLMEYLTKLSISLATVNGSSLSSLASGVSQLGSAMQNMNAGTADFTRLAKNITKIGSVDSVALTNTATSLQAVTKAVASISAIPQNATQVTEFAKSLGKLGSKSIENAVVNIPKLGNALNGLMTTLSRAPTVSQNVIQMTNALANLASQGSKVGTSSNSLQKSLYGVSTSVRTATKSSWNLASAIGKFYATYFMVIRGSKKLIEAIKSTTDYIEAFNYQAVAFGKIGSEWDKDYEKYGYDNATAYAESFQSRVNDTLGKLSGLKVNVQGGLLEESGVKNLGLNIQEITQYASQLASVTNSLGQTGEATTAITKSMTMLAGDISSLFNVDYSTVAQNLQSGLIGQSRALYKYGIDITNATLATYAYNLGISKSVSEMTQMEKQQLRVLAILDQSKVSWGDLANTINSPSNMLRQFSNNMKEVGMVAGQLFIPILSKVMPVVNGVTIVIKRLLVGLASLMGVKIDFESFGQSGYKDTSDGLEDISDGYQDVSDSAKKATLSLMGFDEINKLQDDTSSSKGSSGGGGGSTIDLTDDIAKAAADYEAAWNKAFANMENSAVAWADKIEKALEPVKQIFKDFAIGDFYAAGQDTSNLVAGIFNWFAKAIDDVPWFKIGQKMGDFLAGINWTKVFKSAAKVLVQGLKAAIELYLGMLSKAPIETLLISLVAVPKVLKAIGGSAVVASIVKTYKTLDKFATTVAAATGALNGNKAAASALTFMYPKAAKTVTDVNKTFNALKTSLNDNGFFATFNEGIETIRGKMSVLQKGAIGVIGVFAEFSLVKSGFYELTVGSDNLVASIAKIAGGVGVATAALKLIGLSNPFTALIVGAMGLISSIVGISQAVKEAEFNSMFTALQNTGTVTMKELGDVAKDSFGKITDGITETTDKLKNISEAKENLEETTNNVNLLKTAVEDGAYTTNEKMPEIIEQFQNLLSESKNVFNDEYDVIVGNVVGAWKDILEAQGVAIPEYVAQLASLRDKGNESFTSMSSDLETLIQQFNDGKISEEEFLNAATPLIDKISSINSDKSVDNATLAIQGFGGALDISQYMTESGLDVQRFSEAVNEVVTAAQNGKDNLSTLGTESSQAITDMRDRLTALGIDASQFDWSSLYGASDTQVQQGTERIDAAYMQYANQVQYNLLNQLPSVVEQATVKYENLNPIAKIFTTKENYIKSVIEKWRKSTLDPALDSVKDGFNQLGIDGSVYADEAADKLTTSLFDSIRVYSNVGVNNTKPKLKEDWQEMLDSALNEAGEAVDVEGYGRNTVDGFVDGIVDNVDRSNNAVRDWMDELDRNIHDSAMNFGSPSRRAEEYGRWVVEGFNNGLSDNLGSTYSTIDDYVNNVKSGFDGIYDSLWDIGHYAGRGFYDGLESMENSIFSEARYIADNVSDTIRDALDIHSPSRVMKQIGEYTIEGFKQGMELNYKPVEVSLGDFTSDIIQSTKASKFNANTSIPTMPQINMDNSATTETNMLLRQLIYAVENGRTIEIDGQEIFRVTQKQADMYTAMTGLPAYNI